MNLYKTWAARPKTYADVVGTAPPLPREFPARPIPASTLADANVMEVARTIDQVAQLRWHRRWEGLPVKLTVWTIIAVASASLFEIIPTFVIRSNVEEIASVQPYTPLELRGRDIYVSEGCYNCHSQMIRPLNFETERYGPYSEGGEFVYDHPSPVGQPPHRSGPAPRGWHSTATTGTSATSSSRRR